MPPDEDREPEPDEIAGVDADESENKDVITNAALIRGSTEEYYEDADDSS